MKRLATKLVTYMVLPLSAILCMGSLDDGCCGASKCKGLDGKEIKPDPPKPPEPKPKLPGCNELAGDIVKLCPRSTIVAVRFDTDFLGCVVYNLKTWVAAEQSGKAIKGATESYVALVSCVATKPGCMSVEGTVNGLRLTIEDDCVSDEALKAAVDACADYVNICARHSLMP